MKDGATGQRAAAIRRYTTLFKPPNGLTPFPCQSHAIHEMNLLLKSLPVLLPVATAWVEWEERKILRHGIPLTPDGLLDAAKMGVAHPEKIRLMKVDRIPLLIGPFIKLLARAMPEISSETIGLSLRYGIYVRSRYWPDRHLIAHECVHTGQYERSGSVSGFLRGYFSECLEAGYPDAPMEQEAIMRSEELDY